VNSTIVTGAVKSPKLTRPPSDVADDGGLGDAQAVDKTNMASRQMKAIILGNFNMKTTPSLLAVRGENLFAV